MIKAAACKATSVAIVGRRRQHGMKHAKFEQAKPQLKRDSSSKKHADEMAPESEACHTRNGQQV